jgi:tetratricopeptide (TPR) repeat protein
MMGKVMLIALALAAPAGVARAADAPGAARSSAFATSAAKAEMAGAPRQAIRMADAAIKAAPQDPWPYYDKAMSLARLGRVDEAVIAFDFAEQKFSPSDTWGKSVAVYGRAHTLSEAGRCDEAKTAFFEYASIVKDSDPSSAAMARRYAAECESPESVPSPTTAGAR